MFDYPGLFVNASTDSVMNDPESQVVKVFFPHCLLNSASGLCLGITNAATKSVCILAVAHTSCNHAGQDADEPFPFSDLHSSVVGTFVNRATLSPREAPPSPAADAIVSLEQKHHNGIPECRVMRSPWQQKDTSPQTSPLFILFDERQAIRTCCGGSTINSTCLTEEHSKALETKQCNASAPPGSVKLPSCHELDFVVSSVQEFSRLASIRSAPDRFTHYTLVRLPPDSRAASLLKGVLWVCAAIPILLVRSFLHCLDCMSCTRLCRNSLVQSVATYPVTGAHLANKISQLFELVRDVTRNKSQKVAPGESSHTIDFIRRGNVLSTVVVDLLLGLVVFTWMRKANVPGLMAGIIETWAEQTGVSLQQLLHWLMGAPAGLKLNTSLAHFLGNFFLYHVYLWIGYLNNLLPWMSVLLWCSAGAGVLGLSFQLALVSDLLSLLTFHIYCFYVYAARIYSLQVSALLSLARLFQGKKWNVLRQRVDHCSYDVDQLFMGTLLFTMLLFLLPTTVLFYVVFTLLRLTTLVLQSLLSLARESLRCAPWLSLGLWLTASDTLNARVEFQALDSSPGQPTALSLQMQPMPLSEALRFGQQSPVTSSADKQTLPEICKKLVRGDLIYPWGGDRS